MWLYVINKKSQVIFVFVYFISLVFLIKFNKLKRRYININFLLFEIENVLKNHLIGNSYKIV